MSARIFARSGALRGLSVDFVDEATLGRSRNATVHLQVTQVSGNHAQIKYEPAERCYFLTDLESLNGTALDGVPVTRPERLGHLHVITLAGEHDVIFQDMELCAERHKGRPTDEREGTNITEAAPAVPAALAPKKREKTDINDGPLAIPAGLGLAGPHPRPSGPAPLPTEAAVPQAEVPQAERPRREPEPPTAGLPADAHKAVTDKELEALLLRQAAVQVTLVVHTGQDSVRRYPLSDGEHLVGRDVDVAIRIANENVSRHHAVLMVDGGKVILKDLGSSNHTYVNGEKIEGSVEIPIGTRLVFAEVEARLIGGN